MKAKEKPLGTQTLSVWGPFRPLPDVKDMEIIVRPWDDIFLKFGIKKRADSAQLSYEPYRNRAMNRYLEHQLIRLSSARSEKLYWTIAFALMSRSNVFVITCLNHVFDQ